MMPVTKFICDECGEVKDLKDAEIITQEGWSVFICKDCRPSIPN